MRLYYKFLDNLKLVGERFWNGKFNYYTYKESCKYCGEPFLTTTNGNYCL